MSSSLDCMHERWQKSKKELEKVKAKHEQFNFPEFLEELRRTLNLKLKEVSEDVGIKYVTYRLIEKGLIHRMPTADKIRRISQYYEVPYDLLIDKAEEYLNEICHTK